MSKTRWIVGAGVLALLAVTPASAHHSFAATYFVDKTITIEGSVAQFLFRNPHTFVHVEVKDASGKPVRWAAEWAAGTALTQQGVGREALKAGDQLVLVGNPGRSEADHRIRVNSIVRPRDGWKWSGTFQ